MKRQLSLNNLLQRTGGWYIIIIIAIAPLSAFVGAAIGTISIYFNAELDPQKLAETSQSTPWFILTGNLILLTIAWYLTPYARKRLTAWSTNQLKTNPKEELAAWKEITSLTWRYGTAALIVAYLVDIVPSAVLSFQKNTELRSIGGSGIIVTPVTYIFEEEPPRYTAMLEALKG